MLNVEQRRRLQLADVRWVLGRHQTCADCLRPQRVDYWAPDGLWNRVVGKEVCLCVECFLRRVDAEGLPPPEMDVKLSTWASFDHDDECDRFAEDAHARGGDAPAAAAPRRWAPGCAACRASYEMPP